MTAWKSGAAASNEAMILAYFWQYQGKDPFLPHHCNSSVSVYDV
jgi:hypothetical protein